MFKKRMKYKMFFLYVEQIVTQRYVAKNISNTIVVRSGMVIITSTVTTMNVVTYQIMSTKYEQIIAIINIFTARA
jgi:hypothetical protein